MQATLSTTNKSWLGRNVFGQMLQKIRDELPPESECKEHTKLPPTPNDTSASPSIEDTPQSPNNDNNTTGQTQGMIKSPPPNFHK